MERWLFIQNMRQSHRQARYYLRMAQGSRISEFIYGALIDNVSMAQHHFMMARFWLDAAREEFAKGNDNEQSRDGVEEHRLAAE